MALRLFKFCRPVTRVLFGKQPLLGLTGSKSLCCLGVRGLSTEKRSFTSFDSMVEFRRGQAGRSVLIQVYSGYSYDDLAELCNDFGAVKDTFYYTGRNDLHFILVEFESREAVKKVLDAGSFGQNMPPVPSVTPFLWMKASKIKKTKQGATCPEAVADSEAKPEHLVQALTQASSISEQMVSLHSLTRMGELGTRLRFLTAHQLESTLSGAFPYCKFLPFGSSVNGFGKAGCDLDLVLQLGGLEEGKEIPERKSPSRLVFHNKNLNNISSRSLVQRHMEVLADFMHQFVPGCTKIQRILHARVPIIKFEHDLTMIECDLSMTNMTAVHMSELLYLMGEIDSRVRPLVCTIRRWAMAVSLTNPTPGRWISNFSLTLLTIYYLQKCEVLPSLGTLIALSGPTDSRFTAEGINCTFLRDLSNLALSKNSDSLEQLLAGFFNFYASFDFGSKGISLVAGKEIPKPDHSPLYIENPLERYLNVSKNVNLEETLRLKVEFTNAAWFLEQLMDEDERKGNWGLLTLLTNPTTKKLTVPQRKNFRLVQVKDLFDDSDSEPPSQPRAVLREAGKFKNRRR